MSDFWSKSCLKLVTVGVGIGRPFSYLCRPIGLSPYRRLLARPPLTLEPRGAFPPLLAVRCQSFNHGPR